MKNTEYKRGDVLLCLGYRTVDIIICHQDSEDWYGDLIGHINSDGQFTQIHEIKNQLIQKYVNSIDFTEVNLDKGLYSRVIPVMTTDILEGL
jgi:hypothetical protein